MSLICRLLLLRILQSVVRNTPLFILCVPNCRVFIMKPSHRLAFFTIIFQFMSPLIQTVYVSASVETRKSVSRSIARNQHPGAVLFGVALAMKMLMQLSFKRKKLMPCRRKRKKNAKKRFSPKEICSYLNWEQCIQLAHDCDKENRLDANQCLESGVDDGWVRDLGHRKACVDRF